MAAGREPIFDAPTRARLRALRLAIRRNLSGDAGLAQVSRRRGGRHEFRDHRAYAVGDDFRDIDWSLYGRLGELFVKRFAAETDVDLEIVIDRSASMGVGRPTKHAFACRLAAAFGFGLGRDGRRVRVQALGEQLVPVSDPVRSEADCAAMLTALEAMPDPRGRADPACVRELLRPGPRSRIVVLLSDFLDARPLAATLGGRTSSKVDLILGLVLADEERRPAPAAFARLVGVEGEGRISLEITPEVLVRYAAVLEAHVADLQRFAARHGAGFHELAAEEPFDRALIALLRAGGLAS